MKQLPHVNIHTMSDIGYHKRNSLIISHSVETCQYIETPRNGTKTFLRAKNHNVGSEIEFTCDDDFIPVGPEYRVCQIGGDWSGGQHEDEIINECVGME